MQYLLFLNWLYIAQHVSTCVGHFTYSIFILNVWKYYLWLLVFMWYGLSFLFILCLYLWCLFLVVFSGCLPFLILVFWCFDVEFIFTFSCSCVVLVLLCGTWLCYLFGVIYFCCPLSVWWYDCAAVLLYDLCITVVLILSSLLLVYCLVADFLIIITSVVSRRANLELDAFTASDVARTTD
jgi:hypothetical protein